eukprot:TRINITY_DN12410_c2_g1_i1.p2 TRINITY_DN12410_c2_g1~~TRINITY_DN12410_c2_g1_i1.p2  ORF type:complete len:176 (-),score=38.29 TRINITY_DN12410_c2_g1_i1:104-631(-)
MKNLKLSEGGEITYDVFRNHVLAVTRKRGLSCALSSALQPTAMRPSAAQQTPASAVLQPQTSRSPPLSAAAAASAAAAVEASPRRHNNGGGERRGGLGLRASSGERGRGALGAGAVGDRHAGSPGAERRGGSPGGERGRAGITVERGGRGRLARSASPPGGRGSPARPRARYAFR